MVRSMTPAIFRKWRMSCGVKQTEVARAIGVSSAALCRYERGVCKSVGDEKLAIAEAVILRLAVERARRAVKAAA